jgi:hypothetical protein
MFNNIADLYKLLGMCEVPISVLESISKRTKCSNIFYLFQGSDMMFVINAENS